MSLDSDVIVDRRRLKRALVFWRIAALAFAVAVGAVVAGRLDDVSPIGRYVGELWVEDLILDDAARLEALTDAVDDDKMKALVVRINSPGGTVVGGESLYRALRKVADKKPVVAVMGELATSAGYMVALGADQIYANAGTVTGSIGVLMETADITGLLEKVGVKPELVKSAPLKAQPNPMEPFSEEARKAMRAVIMDMYEMFVDMVAERRNMNAAEARALADGRVFTGRQAKKNGLIDAVGGLEEARAWLAEKHEVEEKLPLKSIVEDEKALWLTMLTEEGDARLWPGLVQFIFGKTVFSEGLRLDGLVSVWHPEW